MASMPHSTGSDRFGALLRGSGLRVTGVRLSVLEALHAAGEALTAQRVFETIVEHEQRGKARGRRRAPDRVTVYRTLNTLVEEGLAHRVDPGDRVYRFQLTDHARCTEKHHDHEHPHFVCDNCGSVECLQGARVEVSTPKAASRAPARTIRQDVVLHGRCGECEDQND